MHVMTNLEPVIITPQGQILQFKIPGLSLLELWLIKSTKDWILRGAPWCVKCESQ